MAFVNWLFPRSCFICKLKANTNICDDCLRELPWQSKICSSCAEPLPKDELDKCGECLLTSPPIDHCVVVFRYEPPISSLITGLKFRNKLYYAALLGKLLATKVSERYQATGLPLPDCIMPIPLSSMRLRKRGYNQAMELARYIKRHLHISIDYRTVKRMKETQPQTLLSRELRQANVKQAFALNRQIDYEHIAIVDDVATTFSTLFEIAKVLKKQGVWTVDAWCVAKANA